MLMMAGKKKSSKHHHTIFMLYYNMGWPRVVVGRLRVVYGKDWRIVVVVVVVVVARTRRPEASHKRMYCLTTIPDSDGSPCNNLLLELEHKADMICVPCASC